MIVGHNLCLFYIDFTLGFSQWAGAVFQDTLILQYSWDKGELRLCWLWHVNLGGHVGMDIRTQAAM